MKRKLLLIVSVILLLTLNFNFQVLGQEEPTVVKVGYFVSEGYQELRDERDHFGYGEEYLNVLAEKAGFEYEYVYGTYQECLLKLNSGEIDMMGFVTKTQGTQDIALFPYFDSGYYAPALVTSVENTELNAGNVMAFENLNVGYVAGKEDIFELDDYAAANNMTYTKHEYNTQQQLYDDVNRGVIDAAFVNSIDLDSTFNEILTFDARPFYFVVNKNSTEIYDKLNAALSHIETHDYLFEDRLRGKYYTESFGFDMEYTQEEKDFVENNPTVKVAIDPEFLPIEGYSQNNKTPTGYTVLLLDLISQTSGINFEYVVTENFQDSLDALNSGRADVLSGANASISDYVDFTSTTPYLNASVVMVGKKNAEINPGSDVVVAMPPKTGNFETTISKIYPGCSFDYYDNRVEAYDAVSSGSADLMATNIYVAQSEILSGYNDLAILYDIGEYSDYKFLFGQDTSPLLAEIFQKNIDALSESQINSMLVSSAKDVEDTQGFAGTLLIAGLIIIVLGVAILFTLRLQRAHKELVKRAYYDRLTGLRNFEKFIMDAQEIRKKSPNVLYAVNVLDVRNFHMFNDFYGHKAGDELLKTIGMAMEKELHKHTEVYGRVSSDKFVTFTLVDLPEDLIARGESMKANYREMVKGTPFEKTVFVYGTYIMLPQDVEVRAAYEKANIAHKLAKKDGSKEFYIFDEELSAKEKREQMIESTMRDALFSGEFKMFLQPQYFTQTQKISGAEALVRWIKDDGTMVPLPHFIEVVERNGFITEIDYFMFESACKLIRSWIDEGIKPIEIAVNFSRLHLQESNFVEKLCDIAKKYDVDHKYLHVELTESAAMENQDSLLNYMKQFQDNGFKLAIDDFGSGYSSLGLLKSFKVDLLKLDKTFFDETDDSIRMMIIVEVVIYMAKQLGVKTVAEGIEQEGQVAFLKEMGCDIIQGYYFAKPMPADEVTKKLREQKTQKSKYENIVIEEE